MTNYAKGYRFECRVVKNVQRHGYLAVRSGGSRGKVDVMAIHPCNPPILVQCKTDGRLPPDEHQALWLLGKAYNATPILAWKDEQGHIEYSEIGENKTYEDWHPGDGE